MKLCVCIPARNEADRLPIVLDALAEQDWPGVISVSIAINNSTDSSLAVIEQARLRHGERLDLHVKTVTFAPDNAHAGSARRLAMDEGLRLLPTMDNAALVSTDADSRPPAGWLGSIADSFAGGADLVGGRIDIDEDEALPAPVQRLRTSWDQYWVAVRAIEDAIDPLPWDPAPRHGDHTGASLAIRADVYLACGGVPVIPTGEDRALVMVALAAGAKLVHPVSVYTRVSPRRTGRADGGMAVAMHSLFAAAQKGGETLVPDFAHWRERAMWRRRLRGRTDGQAVIARREPLLPPMPHDMALEMVP